MKSIKPGRGPSKFSSVASVFAALFGVFWCVVAGAKGAWFMIPFGLIFVGLTIYSAVYNHHNATSEERYSVIDIVDSEEEGDPLGRKFAKDKVNDKNEKTDDGTSADFCPYCGSKVGRDFDYCPKCGNKLPD